MDKVSSAFSETSFSAPARGPATALPEAVLWDMDGTIIDTEPQWLAAEVALAERHGGTWTEAMGDKLIGMALPESIRIFRDLAEISAPPEQLIVELIEEMVRQSAAPLPPTRTTAPDDTTVNGSSDGRR